MQILSCNYITYDIIRDYVTNIGNSFELDRLGEPERNKTVKPGSRPWKSDRTNNFIKYKYFRIIRLLKGKAYAVVLDVANLYMQNNTKVRF